MNEQDLRLQPVDATTAASIIGAGRSPNELTRHCVADPNSRERLKTTREEAMTAVGDRSRLALP